MEEDADLNYYYESTDDDDEELNDKVGIKRQAERKTFNEFCVLIDLFLPIE